MNNQVNLTDDELTLIATALQLAVMSHERYMQLNGEESLDHQSKEAYRKMKTLLDRLNKEYF